MPKRICLSLLQCGIRPSTRQCNIHQPSSTTTSTSSTIVLGHDLRQHSNNKDAFLQRRAFASSHQRRATALVKQRKQSQPSMSVTQKKQQAKAQKDGSLLPMIGLLEGTFIPPTGKNIPSIFSAPRDRLKIEYNRAKLFYVYFMSLYQLRFMVKPKLKFPTRASIATASKTLYEQMYTSFASGTLPRDGSLSEGLAGSLERRMAQRPAGTNMTWKLHSYLSAPKVVSRSFLTVPGGTNETRDGIMQSVVKLHTRQSLSKTVMAQVRDPQTRRMVTVEQAVDSAGNVIPEEEVERQRERDAKDIVEYLVLQRFMRTSELDKDWHIWGTTEETTLKRLLSMEKKAAEMYMKAGSQKAA